MKVSIIGAGAVGVGICNYLLTMGECQEVVLVDLNKERTRGEQLDFSHTSALTFAKNTKIIAGEYEDTRDSDVVVITAGAQIKVGQDRLEIGHINAKIAVDIARQLEHYTPNAILIVVTNPCDILTHFIIRNTNFPAHRVISAGCVVDTARMMKIIADKVKIDPKNVFGYVMGEHGANSFIPWSIVNIAGQKIDDFCQQNDVPMLDPQELLNATKAIGLEVFSLKLNTNHAIAASVFRIIRAISINEYSVLPVGTMLNGEYGLQDVVINVPMVISNNGVEHILKYKLPANELEQLHQCANALRQVVEKVAESTGLNC
ncbi:MULTISPECIES: lactate/malate family dehydrogenase [unclassified Avibacterium]|uniref:lactate/malate family dehydrogenase n=1 Tax=unclassified Avibacterium TaxID=2685287 RepID=UPI00202674C3|nr:MULTISPECIES: L-lactate dehydrogenase [unclassified Avibacterium]URL01015.1 L-lactate dehydrogenase [Avibacterium sp. 20-126]MCW9697991.1 L-lactate dehydrogenase [Avibacterium sp. 20-129]MCW9733890.1 L-lactate dehydrogenase [Avibacterium sp. 20-15]URL03952.1 L-lactate dehydrogenase [Avibacterium sp. 20-132]URL05681.1 L-lactate dehydrogenase [Avibacterium sp. 21-595]